MQVARLVRAAALDHAALDLDGDFMNAFGCFDRNRFNSRFLQVQIDLRRSQDLGFSQGVKIAQHAARQLHRAFIAEHAKHAATIGNLDAKAKLDLTQVFVKGPDQIGQAFAVFGFKGEIVADRLIHRRGRLARARSVCQRVFRAPAFSLRHLHVPGWRIRRL